MRKFQTFDEFKEESLRDPNVKAAYDSMEAEYKIAESMIEARLARKLTQAQLAELAGVKQTTIARLESGTNNSTIATLSRVAHVLGKELRVVGSR